MYVSLKTNGIKFVYRVALRSYSVSSFGFLQYLHVQCKPRTILLQSDWLRGVQLFH